MGIRARIQAINWRGTKNLAEKAFLKIPLVGQLVRVEPEALKQAFYETLSTTIFATLPLWFLPAVGPYFNDKSATLADSALHGEVFIYAAVLLGPLIYVISKRYGRFNIRGGGPDEEEGFRTGPLSFIFPYGGFFLTLCAFMCFLAGFALTKLRVGPGHRELPVETQLAVERLSLLVFLVTTICFFLICAYRNMLDDQLKNAVRDIVKRQPEEETDFTNLWLRTKS